MERFICIHGHFYQPPRENPWLEAVELQDSAAPYHDWNERISAECYAPNATARMVDAEGRIQRIVNNYSKISFNFGPTLLSWMKDKLPVAHEAIVEADRQSRERFSGHGSALAQVYSHVIMPLANARDKFTQTLWGIRDFEFRFGRQPEGMWLSETAADIPTLETLAELGIKFTILSPYQASRARRLHAKSRWNDVNGGQIDPTRPYLIRLPSGKSIAAFFYDGHVSRAVAFEQLLKRGENLAERMMSAFSHARDWDQLVHIATDGESYGHHHRHGEMALAYALDVIEKNNWARLANYGEFLEKHPPTHEAQIHEPSAWSCAHGVGRWKENCGCNSGGHGGWNQNWRAPLRHALDWLRDELGPLFEEKGRELFKDPWAARNAYIAVLLDRSPDNREKFFAEQGSRPLIEEEKVVALGLMELQRHAMLMYTSCGWFFDELSGIETVQVIQYAGRAIQLARTLAERDLEPGFLERLEHAKSNIPEHRDGRLIYEKFVRPAAVDWDKAVAHYAISSIFHEYGDRTKIFLYNFESLDRHSFSAGRPRLLIGKTRAEFEITLESAIRGYAVLYMGEHNLTGAVREFPSKEAYEAMVREVKESFERADFPETIRLIDRHFGSSNYSLKTLFKDEQRRILDGILSSTRDDLENRYRAIAERYTPLMRFLSDLGAPLPEALKSASDFVLHVDIAREFESSETNLERLKSRVDEALARNVAVFDDEMNYRVKNKLESLMDRVAARPDDEKLLVHTANLAGLVRGLPLNLNLWRVQDAYWDLWQKFYPDFKRRLDSGDETARVWITCFRALGEQLGFAVEGIEG